MISRLYCAFVAILFFSFSLDSFSQSSVEWTDVEEGSFTQRGPQLIQPTEYRLLEVDFQELKSNLENSPLERTSGQAVLMEVPMPDGENLTFEMVYSPIYEQGFQDRYPEIRTYAGSVVDRPGVYGRFDVTPAGFHGMIFRAGESTVFIDPYTFGGQDVEHYISYDRAHYVNNGEFSCGTQAPTKSNTPEDFEAPDLKTPYASCVRREYRLAVAATGEYTDFHGGTVAQAAAAQVVTMNRVNGIYERDLGIRMIIIANNDQIIYTDGSTDPFSNGNAGSMINENQSNTNNVIGAANYDIGHLFGTAGSGLAGLGVVCSDGSKARGITGLSSPIGDVFDVDYVSHEMGHQFAGNHTQNNSCNRVSAAAMEPGSASTIMGYAGICAPNVQNNSDDHFHGYSLQEMGDFISGFGGTCAVNVDISNSHPTISSVTTGHTIPGGTPFALTAVATDAEGDLMTFCWEQIDNEIATMPPTNTSTGGPAFRSNSPALSPTRHFPNLADQLAGVSPTWEVLSTATRDYNFRVSVRDNNAGGSCTEYQDALIQVDGNSGPFIVLNPSSAGVSWSSGSTQTITWDVAGTNSAPVSCSFVDIELSTDGGQTFSVLASNVENDGTHDVIVPNEQTTTARIRIVCADNVFYDISDNDFAITVQIEAPCQGGFAGIYPCNKYDLIAHLDISQVGGGAGVEANDIWGWTDGLDGKEYALLGLTTGTAFIDISDPTAPIHLGNLPTATSNSAWRDVKVFNDYAFIVSEAANHGMQIFDLTNLRNVTSPPITFTADLVYTEFGSAHNIVINEQTGYAYGVGAGTFSGGLDFVNINNPLNPLNEGGFSEDGYTHDAQVVIYNGPDPDHAGKEIAFACNEDTFTIIDIDNKTDPIQISRTGYTGSSYTHQGWLTEDQQYFLINDELDENSFGHNTRTYMWNVIDLDAPVLIGYYEHAQGAIDHNLYIHEGLVYESNYRAGLRVLDHSDIANGNLVEVGYFDVYPANDNAGFNGSWSNYPYFESGNIIISSIEDGLFIVHPSPPVVCSDPVSLSASNITEAGADLSWTESGSATIWDIEIVPSGDSPTGIPTVEDHPLTTYTFSGGTPSTAYDFYVRADCGGLSGNGESFWVGPLTFVTSFTAPTGVDCVNGSPAFVLTEEFESQGAWTGDISTDDGTFGSWIIGYSGPTFSEFTGPDGAFSGSNYMYYEASNSVTNTAVAISPGIDLTTADAASGAELSFYLHAYGQSVGTFTVGVSTSNTGPFTNVFTWSGQFQTTNSDPWVPVGIDMSAYVGSVVFLELSHTGAGDYRGDLCVDLLRVEACGTFCIAPSGLSAAPVGDGGVLSWIENSGSTSWDIEVLTSGTTPTGTPTAAGVTANPYSLTGLASNTTYDVYVRSICPDGSNSIWIGPASFTTEPDFCAGDTFYDTGGATGNYDNNENYVKTICPDGNGHVEVTFTLFDVEDRSEVLCWDELFIYDGNSVTDPAITPASLGIGTTTEGFCYDPASGVGVGDLTGQTVVSTHSSGCLTFAFESDGSVIEQGWAADVVCVSACPWDLVPNGVIDIDDFLAFNSAYGNSCADCPEDFNDDNIVNVDDFLALNSVYGQSCSNLIQPASNELRIAGLNPSLLEDLMAAGGSMNPELLEAIDKLESQSDFIVYPNPNDGQSVQIFALGVDMNAAGVTVRDVAGRLHIADRGSDTSEIIFDNTLSPGVYFIELNTGTEILTRRLVIE